MLGIYNTFKSVCSYIRTFMSQHGMPRIAGLAPEDLFLNFDADEIPKVEAVTFLKLHWGFQQPIRDSQHNDTILWRYSFDTLIRTEICMDA